VNELKIDKVAELWWLIPIILATREAKIRGIVV
jgi:hypothetical protein